MQRVARAGLSVGIAAVVLGLSKVHATAHGYDFTASARFGWALAFIGLCWLATYAFGLPDLVRTRRHAWLAALGAAGVAAIVVSLVQLGLGSELLPRSVVLGTAMVLVPLAALSAATSRDAHTRDKDRDRVVLVADADAAADLETELARAPERPASIVAVLSLADARPTDPPTLPLVDAATTSAATVIVLDRAAQSDEDIVLQAAALHERGMRVRTLSLFYEQWLGKLPVSELERVSLLFYIGEIHAPRYPRIKRLVDVSIAVLTLPLLVVLTPVVAIANLLGNRGPLFFAQPRTGRGGRTFRMVKFRTMTPRGDGAGDCTAVDDPRVTPFGGVLRRMHLDELPQLWNIL